jgi:flagellar hook protein FlgE
MTLQSVLRTGIAGLKSQATRMSTISHNVANARTDGYKAGTASFASLVNAGGGGGGGGSPL